MGERVKGTPRFYSQDVLELSKLDTTGELVCFSVETLLEVGVFFCAQGMSVRVYL